MLLSNFFSINLILIYLFRSLPTIFYVPGRGANVPDKNGKVEGDNAVAQTQLIADELQKPVTLIPRRNYVGGLKFSEEISGIYNRLVGTSKISTAKQLEEQVKQSVEEGNKITVIADSAGGFETMDAANALIPKLSANEAGLVNIIFVGSPLASQDIENLKEFNFNSVNSLSNSADEIPNCVGIGGVGLQAILYSLGKYIPFTKDHRGLTLGQCEKVLKKEYSPNEIKKAHELKSYLHDIKQTVEDRK